MSTVVKASISQSLAQAFIDDIFLQKNRYYFGIGRSYPWPGGDDITPDSLDTEKYEIQTRNDMLLFKSIDGNNLSFIIDRINWVTNTVYQKYDDNVNQEGQNFYVLASNFNVYKCLYNNEGAESTVEPYGTTLEPITYSDGYVWKYIYSIPPALQTKFLTSGSMPIYNSITSEYYSRGSLNNFQIRNAGDGYTQEGTSIIVVGDGYLEDNPLKIIDVGLQNIGSGYTTIPTVELSDPVSNAQEWVAGAPYVVDQNIFVDDGNIRYYRVVTGGNAGLTEPTHYYSDQVNGTLGLKHVGTKPILESTIDDSAVGSVIITEPGFGYTTQPTITKTGPGSGATFIASIQNTSINSISVVLNGTGYEDNAMTISSPFPSAIAFVNSTAVSLNAVLNFEDRYYRVTAAGTTQASGGPDHESGSVLSGTALLQYVGKDAVIEAVLGIVDSISISGDIEKVNIDNKGMDYDETTTVEFSGGDPIVPAVANVTVADGEVISINVSFPGIGYQSAPTVTINGPGTGAAATAVLQYGYGYQNTPEVIFDEPDNINGNLATASVATQKTEALLEPIVIDGKIRGVRIIDGGVGYTTANIIIIGDGEEASITPLFTSGDLVTPQTRNEIFAVPGQLSSITIEDAGSNISSINATIDGDGEGAIIEPVIFGGELVQIKVLNGGSGYTNATINFILNEGATEPEVRTIISPIRGHGSNPIKELYAKSLAIYTKFSDETNNNIQTDNEYRQISIVKNPLRFNLDLVATEKTLSSCIIITTPSNLTNIEANHVLLNTDGSGFRVIEIVGQSVLLQPTENSTLSPNDVLSITINNSINNVVVTNITPPQIDKYSGDILFIDNLAPFKPTPDQAIAIATTIDLN